MNNALNSVSPTGPKGFSHKLDKGPTWLFGLTFKRTII